MGTLPPWFWLAVVDLSFFVAGLSVLWFFARRALRDEVDDERAPRARRTVMQVLEYRLERLLLNPPSWTDIARRLRPYFIGVLGVTAGGLILWGMWTGAASWLAEAPVPRPLPSANGSGLPWESAFDKMRNALSGPIAYTFVLVGLVGGGAASVFGESRRAIPFIAVAVVAFFMINASSLIATLGERPQSESTAPWAGQPVQPTGPDATEIATSADEAAGGQVEIMPQLEAAAAAEAPDESIESIEADQTPLEVTTHRHVTSERRSHFGFGDALMMYGAYKLLTDESPPRSMIGVAPQHAGQTSAAAHTPALAPAHAVSAVPQPKARVRSVYRPSRSRRSR